MSAVVSQGSPSVPNSDPGEITRLLEAVADGRDGAVDELFAATYDDLKELAGTQRRRWRGDETLSTTAVIHEAYLKVARQENRRWDDRGHFFAVASKAMRQILINYARAKRAAKRGGDRRRTTLDGESLLADGVVDEILALDEALEQLAALDARQARVVECRFFGGLSVAETAEAVDVSPATVKRDWAVARAYLKRALSSPEES